MAAEPIRTTGPDEDPRVGVVVLTHNRAGELVRTLEHLLALPERPPIVVVDNGSTDETATLVPERFPAVRYVRLGANLGAAGRNVGVRLCPRPYVALCDDDTWWEPGALARAADLLDAHPSLAVITGKVLVGERERVDPVCELMARSPLPAPPGLPGAPLLGFLAGASMVRRAPFLIAGGFERHLGIGGEEALLAIDLASAGWALAYVDDVVIHHYPSPLRDTRRRARVVARNGLWTAWLRRPWPYAAARTLAVARAAPRDPAMRLALADAVRGLPWVLPRRRVAPAAVERRLRLLDQDHDNGR